MPNLVQFLTVIGMKYSPNFLSQYGVCNPLNRQLMDQCVYLALRLRNNRVVETGRKLGFVHTQSESMSSHREVR